MADQSIFTTLLGELQQYKNHDKSIERCKQIIKELELIIDKRIIAYFSCDNGLDDKSMISDPDALIIENILSVKSSRKDLVLILHSGGGYALSAERIIEVCKSYCARRNDGSKFIVIVPNKAKSAATIVALAADKIYLRDTAELGPVDPQFIVIDKSGNMQIEPAYLYVDAIENIFDLESNNILRKHFGQTKKPLSRLPKEVKLKVIEQCNYSMYVQAKNELGLSDSIIEKISNEQIKQNRNIKKDDFNIFKDPHITKSHGRLINFSDLENNGLRKEGIIDKLSSLFEGDDSKYKKFDLLLWELYVRKQQLVNDVGNQILKTIEGSEEFIINLGIKKGQILQQKKNEDAQTK
jgi:ATP-dependent protease ClpP protease subunit